MTVRSEMVIEQILTAKNTKQSKAAQNLFEKIDFGPVSQL